MSRRDGKRPSPALLAAYVEGEVTRSEAAAIERDLAASREHRHRVEALHEIRNMLSAPAPELARVDLAARVRAARGRAGAQPAASSRRRFARWRPGLWALGAAAAGAALIAVLVPGLVRPGAGDGFTAKSAAGAAGDDSARWAGIRAYRHVGDGRAPQPLAVSLSARDGLLFSYSNLGPHAFAYLMIFARDAAGQVSWFYPAYERTDSDPSSISIDAGRADVAMPELIRQPFHSGGLRIFALFSREPRRVHEVERWLAAWSPDQPAPWPDTYLHVLSASVAP